MGTFRSHPFTGCLLGILISSILASPGRAHGGAYLPPPPPPRPRPGDTPGHPQRPGENAPAPSPTAPGSQPATATGAPAATPSAPTTPPPTSPRSLPSFAGPDTTTGLPDLFAWTWWWEFNKEPFLNLRARQIEALPETGSDDYFLGRSERNALTANRYRPTAVQVRERVLPALIRALGSSKSPDVTTACLIALARIGKHLPASERPALSDVIGAHLSDGNQEVAETAVLALGILGSESGALVLSDLLLDNQASRRALLSTKISWRTRTFSAYALGLVGAETSMEDVRRFVVHKLSLALASDTTPTPDLPVACVLAMGRVPLPWSGDPFEPHPRRLPPLTSREAQIQHLIAIQVDPRRHRWVRAHAASALAGLADPADPSASQTVRDAVAAILVSTLGKPKEEAEVRQSCALALGLLGDDDRDPVDRSIREALLAVLDPPLIRSFASISLGRVIGRAGLGEAADLFPVKKELLRILSRRDGDPAHAAALALALYQRGRRVKGAELDTEIRDALHSKLRESRSPLDCGAFSIALGLCAETSARDALLEKLRNTAEDSSRGFAALGLALIGASDAAEEIRSIVAESTYRPVLLRESAIALSMLGDRDGIALLCDRLAGTSSLFAQASLAQAVGRIGDSSAVDPLILLLEDASRPEPARAFAAAALGLVSDLDPLPWNTPYSLDVNYAALPPTLYDAQGFGLLNLL